MSPDTFIPKYEAALATQTWDAVEPLISDGARVVFSDGRLLAGKDAIRAAYEHNFAAIENECFRIENVHWLFQASDSAAYMFDFHWTGLVDGRRASGAGRGMTALVRQADHWVLVGEQLGPKV